MRIRMKLVGVAIRDGGKVHVIQRQSKIDYNDSNFIRTDSRIFSVDCEC